MNELGPQFERTTGHKLVIDFGFPAVFKQRIEAGEAFDVTIMSPVDDDLIKQGKIATGTLAVFGRTGVGMGVRKGAPKPDISTTDAFKRTLLNAKSVAYGRDAATGIYFLNLLERLGLAEDMKAKLKPYGGAGGSMEAVATGDAEIVVNGASLIISFPNVEFVGLFPSELQRYAVFTGGVSTAAKEVEAGKALLKFLTTPAAVAVFEAKGFEPVTP